MPRPIGYKFLYYKNAPMAEKSTVQCQSDNLNSVAMRSEGVCHAYLNKNVTPA